VHVCGLPGGCLGLRPRPGDPRLGTGPAVEQAEGAQRQRDRLVIVLARVVIEPVDPERVLPQPDADQLLEECLVIRQGYPVVAGRLVQAQRQE
jgi:hypothetical protein